MAEALTEYIGKVKLDLSCYEGADLYCDGDVEDELLAIARDLSPVEYERVITEKANWPILYHLSPLRENIISWYPALKGAHVLEVGSGCGAITGAISRVAESVTCIDLSKKRSMINAYRHADCENVTIHVGNFKDVERVLPRKYDVICLIGVFEYGQAYIGGEKPFHDFLNILKKHLAEGGSIVIAIENKMGLKYFAGCREDHLGTFFSGLEDYPAGGVVRTFSREGLIQIASECGFAQSQIHMYYPYPDYKFMHTLYSDRRLPHVGECKDNLRNFDRDRLLLFDEKRVFDGLIRDGYFKDFSNSFLMVLGEPCEIAYARYSNDRARQTGIVTTMRREWVSKKALYPEGAAHIVKMRDSYEKLRDRYEGGEIRFAACYEAEPGVEVNFPYATGISLEEIFDDMLLRGDIAGFHELFAEYYRRISYGEGAAITDYDLIFSNILINGDDWVAIDYEWTEEAAVDTREVAFRALYCYLLEDDSRSACRPEELLAMMGISDEQAEEYRRSEIAFQRRVGSSHVTLGQMRELIGNPAISVENALNGGGAVFDKRRMLQVYEDQGEGLSEETSFYPQPADGEERLALLENLPGIGDASEALVYHIEFDGNTRIIRLDPGSQSALVCVKAISINGGVLSQKELLGNGLSVNGRIIEPGLYSYPTADPQLSLDLNVLEAGGAMAKAAENSLDLVLEITPIGASMAGRLGREYNANSLKTIAGKVARKLKG